MNTPAGKIQAHNFSGSGAFTGYALSYFDTRIQPGADKVKLLEQNAASMAKTGYTIISEKEISLSGNPGLEIVASGTTTLPNVTDKVTVTLHTRDYYVGERHYTLEVMTTQVKENTEASNAFLDSFKLLPGS
jgi:hypothetical protein